MSIVAVVHIHVDRSQVNPSSIADKHVIGEALRLLGVHPHFVEVSHPAITSVAFAPSRSFDKFIAINFKHFTMQQFLELLSSGYTLIRVQGPQGGLHDLIRVFPNDEVRLCTPRNDTKWGIYTFTKGEVMRRLDEALSATSKPDDFRSPSLLFTLGVDPRPLLDRNQMTVLMGWDGEPPS